MYQKWFLPQEALFSEPVAQRNLEHQSLFLAARAVVYHIVPLLVAALVPAAPSLLAAVAKYPLVLLSMEVAIPPASLYLCLLPVVLSRQFAVVLLMM